MTARSFLLAVAGLLVMGLPVLAGNYYHTRVAPRMDALAAAEENLPRDCAELNQQLHQAFMHTQPADLLKVARAGREEGLRLCATGAEQEGAIALKTALQELGIKPRT